MRVRLKGSKGTSYEIPEASWQAALTAAAKQGWKFNGSMVGENAIQASDASKLSQALKQAARTSGGDGWPYLADFLQGNTITIK